MSTTLCGPDPALLQARRIELAAGESIAGTVLRLPGPGAYGGNRLYLNAAGGEVVCLPATAKKGHTVLANELRTEEIVVGDRVVISFFGKRITCDGLRSYRHYEVRRG